LELVELMEKPVPQEKRDLRDSQDHKELQVTREPQVIEDRREILDTWASRENEVCPEPRDREVFLDILVNEETLENVERQALRDPMDQLESQDQWD